jgi:glycine/D-amino acid oxidase-like deaminating enzyme/nitrite reductase/ring-hydroxylating ferredoxin subunit
MKDKKEFNARDSRHQSLWQNFTAAADTANQNPDLSRIFDVIIVGAGITGITTALMLQKAGKSCIIVEAGNIGFGTTGGTSAHLNTFFDSTYPEVESNFGKDAARKLADAGKEAMTTITSLVKEYQIECDLEYKEGYLFSENQKETKQLDGILESSRNAGIEVTRSEHNDVPIPFEKAIRFSGQGQFHPLKYIYGLAAAFRSLGGLILENSFVSDHKEADGLIEVIADGQKLRAENLVYATHMPPGITTFSLRCAPYRSYVLGLILEDDSYPTGLVYDMQEPYHYFRTHEIDGQKYLVLGGEDHKTGHEDPEQAFKNLETYTRQYYNVKSVAFSWSSQYYIPVDGLPYIGPLATSGGNIYMATGFNGNGMMFGTLSGSIISDQILGVENRYSDLFSPSRLKPVAGFTEFVKENADVVWHFVADRFGTDDLDTLAQLNNDEGKIVDFKGEKLAIHKDDHGKVTALSPVCTHAGCIVNFNPAEQSWDCPCHGGRFSVSGKVICGPPRKDLQQINLPELQGQ